MKTITTKIVDGKIAPHCISYSGNGTDQIMTNGIQWKSYPKGRFEIPKSFKIGDHAEFGFVKKGEFRGRLVQAVEIHEGYKIKWKHVVRIEKPKPTTRTSVLYDRAQELRDKKHSSEVWFKNILRENYFWGAIWNHPFMDKYIIDFAWPLEKVGVEIDGEYHLSPKQISYDQKRQKELETAGWKILRFSYPHESDLKSKLLFLADLLNEIRKKRIINDSLLL